MISSYTIPAMSDISQDFESGEMLRYYQVIKGFDKQDFCELISMYLQFYDYSRTTIWGILHFLKINILYSKFGQLSKLSVVKDNSLHRQIRSTYEQARF